MDTIRLSRYFSQPSYWHCDATARIVSGKIVAYLGAVQPSDASKVREAEGDVADAVYLLDAMITEECPGWH